MDIYVVQANDTITSIAEKFGVSVEKLIQDNELERPNELVPGQTIVITYPKQVYTVQEGDTLLSIAQTFGVSLMQLLRNNPQLSSSNLHSGKIIVISYNTKGKITTHGFVYPFVDMDTFKKTLPNLTYISIYNYRSMLSGELISYFDDTEVIQKSIEYGTIPLLLSTTLSPQGEPNLETAYSILLNEKYQDIIIDNTLNIIKSKGYYGVNIIFNYMNTSNQKYYQNFITKVSNRLVNEGYLVFVTINPNIKYNNNDIIFEKVDYSTISPFVNGMLFLQFVWGTNYDPPAPVSNINNLRTFLNYVIASIPPNKVTVGKPVISYDWTLPYIPGKSYANSLTISSALTLAHDVGATIQFDETSQTPFFTYRRINFGMTEEHIVWTIDARSISALVQLISELGLLGAGLWNIMTYLPQLWLVINSQYEIEKLLAEKLNVNTIL